MKYNENLPSKEVDRFTPLSLDSEKFLLSATKKLDLNARSYFKIIKVTRMIADLEVAADVSTVYLAESLQYRQISVA